MRVSLLASFVTAVVLGAGCLAALPTEVAPVAKSTTASFVPPEPTFDFSTVVSPDHPSHQLPELHAAGHGLDKVGHASIQDILPLGTRGSITQVDVWGHYAVVSGMEGGMAFAIVDISDPTAPQAVGWFPAVADGWTARFSDDGQFVFYGCQMFGAPYTPVNEVRGTCEDPTALHAPSTAVGGNPAGVIAVDVRDKTAPKFVDFLATGGSHNIAVANISGVDYIFTSAVTILKFDRTTSELSQVAELPGVHDATAVRHPLTGDWLLFTGTGETSIYNINDPAAPQLLYEGTGSEGWTGWHEQTLVPGLVDGRVILLLSGESFVGTPNAEGGLPDSVFVVNVTDPSKPELVGTWKPPFNPALPWAGYLYSVHEMAATPTGQVAIAWYHGGVWVLDVSTKERQASPVTLAAFQPNELPNVVPATFAQTPLPYVPFVWGAGWTEEGRLVVPDMHTGLYVMEPEWGLVPGASGGQ